MLNTELMITWTFHQSQFIPVSVTDFHSVRGGLTKHVFVVRMGHETDTLSLRLINCYKKQTVSFVLSEQRKNISWNQRTALTKMQKCFPTEL